jgi:hypothetical protein
MAIATFTTQFNLSSSTPQVLITDTTDYVGQGLVAAACLVNTYMESPAGIFHNNTSLITPDMATGGLTFLHDLPLDPSTGDVLAGAYVFTLSIADIGTGADVGSGTNNYTFCFVAPTPYIQLTESCLSSTLVSEDITVYTVNCGGTAVAPTTLTRTHTVKYPINPNTGVAVHADEVSSNAVITITPMWTQTFQTLLSVDLIYVQVDGLRINYLMGGSASIDVACDDTICCIYECIWNAYSKYIYYRQNEGDGRNTQRYREIVFQAYGMWMMYSISLQCGELQEANDRLADLKALLDANNCSCCNVGNDTVPVQVIPIFSSGTGGGTYVLGSAGNGITVTTVVVGTTTTWTLGINGSLVSIPFSNITGLPTTIAGYGITDAYTKAQVQAFFTSISGGLGQITWANVLSKPQVGQILINDPLPIGTTLGVLAWEDLQAYIMPASTMMTKGDMLEFETILSFSPTNASRGYRMYWGSTAIIDDTFIGGATMWLKMTITRTTTGTQFLEWERVIYGYPSTAIKPQYTNAAENLANPTTLKISAKNGTALGAANEVVARYIRVKAYIK